MLTSIPVHVGTERFCQAILTLRDALILIGYKKKNDTVLLQFFTTHDNPNNTLYTTYIGTYIIFFVKLPSVPRGGFCANLASIVQGVLTQC